MQWLLLILIIPYVYLLLIIWKGLSGIKPYSSTCFPGQFVSVIIACRNEEKNLPFLLKDISGQEYNADLFEVIIVDDHSSDRTFEIASGFDGIKNLIPVKNTGNGKKQAIRTGVAASGGKLIVTTDADCRMGERWLSTISSFYEENNPDMIICPVRLETETGFLQKFQELEYLSLQGITAGTAAVRKPVMCNGANMAFTKEAYDKSSGDLHFEIPSGDDVFLLHSIKRRHGSKIQWLESQEAIVKTQPRYSISSFIRQRARWTSKAGAYKDLHIRLLAIVTFVTILLLWLLLATGIFKPEYLYVLLASFALKSVPDFLILYNTAARYRLKNLLKIFLPAQVIYPVYIIVVFFYYLLLQNPDP